MSQGLTSHCLNEYKTFMYNGEQIILLFGVWKNFGWYIISTFFVTLTAFVTNNDAKRIIIQEH